MLVTEYAPEKSEYNKSFLYREVQIGLSDYTSTHFSHLKDNAFYDGNKLLAKDDFAFDHYDLIQEAISRMQGHDSWKPNFFQMLGYEFTVTEILNLVKAILPDKNLIRQNVLREYKNFIIEVGVRRKEGVKSQKTYKYKK